MAKRVIRPGERSRTVELPSVKGDGAVRVGRGTRDAYALIFVSDARCGPGCRSYLASIVAGLSEFAEWDGRVVVVLPERATDAAAGWPVLPEALTLTVDRGSAVRTAFGLPAGRPSAIVMDRWGEVYQVIVEEDESRLPGREALLEWFRYLTIRCPECGVPDEPGGVLAD